MSRTSAMQRPKSAVGFFLFALCLIVSLLASRTAFAIAITSAGNGDWNNTTTWTPQQIPGLGDDVTITSTHIITVSDGQFARTVTFNTAGGSKSLNISGASASLTIGVGAGVGLQLNSPGAGTNTVQVSSGGALTLTAADIDLNGGGSTSAQLDFGAGGGTVTMGGSLSFSGTTSNTSVTVSGGSGTFNVGKDIGAGGSIVTAGSTFVFNGTSAQIINGTRTFDNLTINNSGAAGAVSLNGNIFVNGNITIIDGTFADNGFSLTMNNPATSTLTMASGTELHLGSSATATGFPGITSSANITLNSGSKVVYKTGLNQTLSVVPVYANLHLTNPAALAVDRTFAGTLKVSGGLLVDNGAGTLTLKVDSQTLVADGDIGGTGNINLTSGTIQVGGHFSNTGTLSTSTGTVEYNGLAAQNVKASANYHRLYINKAGIATLLGPVTLSGTLDMNAGTLDDAGNQITMSSGTITMNPGTFLKLGAGAMTTSFPGTTGAKSLSSSSTVVYQSSLGQTIEGFFTYGNLTLSNLGNTVIHAAGGPINVAGTLTVADNGANTTTFNIGNNALNVDTDIAGDGTISAGNTTINAGASWSNLLTFVPGTTPVTFDASSGVYSFGGGPFYDVTINSTSGSYTVSANTTVNNNFTLTSGTVSLTNRVLDIAGNFSNFGTFNGGTGTLEVGATFSNNGTFAAGSGTVIFDKAVGGAQNLNSAAVISFYNLTSNNLANQLLVNQDASIAGGGALALNDDRIDVQGGKQLFIDVNASVTRSPGGFVTGQLTMGLNPAPARTFHVGSTSGIYMPVDVDSGSAGYLTIEVKDTATPPHPNRTGLGANGLSKYWMVSAGTVTSIDSFLFNYDDASISAGTEALFVMGQYYNGGWIPHGLVDDTSTNVDLVSAPAFFSGDWAIAEPAWLAPPSYLTVQNINDSGTGSLREALTILNNGGCETPCTIGFNTSGNIVLQNINGPLPAINVANTTIDGTTTDGITPNSAVRNSNAFGSALNANLAVSLDGSSLSTGLGFHVTADNVTIRGIGIRGFNCCALSKGIHIDGVNNATIKGCYIGVANDGTTPAPNDYGIYVNGGTGHTIGGSAVQDFNLISGNNSVGITAFGISGSSILGNYVGVKEDLTVLGNLSGIEILQSNGNFIGTAALGNIVGGNSTSGIALGDSDSNTFENNRIGTYDTAGTSSIQNSGNGITIIDYLSQTSQNNLIKDSNTIARNGDGVVLSTTGIGNVIAAARIHSHNFGAGIDLGANLSTVNDLNDTDSGNANNYQNYPDITSAVINGPNVDVVLSQASSSAYFQIRVYQADTSIFPQGKELLGSSNCEAAATLNPGPFTLSVPKGPVVAGNKIVATTTSYSESTCTTVTDGTSEFSPAVSLAGVYNWNNVAGGPWETTTSWTPNGLPGAGDTAIINAAGSYTILLNGAVSVATLTIGNGSSGVQTLDTNGNSLGVTGVTTVTSTGNLAVNSLFDGTGLTEVFGTLNWTGGTISGAGALNLKSGSSSTMLGGSTKTLNKPVTVEAGAALNWTGGKLTGTGSITNNGTSFNLNGGSTLFIDGGFSITNSGTATWIAGNLQIDAGGGSIINTGTFNISGNVGTIPNGGTLAFTNSGTLSKTGGAGNSDLSLGMTLDNAATVSTTVAAPGRLIVGSGTSTGTFNAGATGIIRFGNGHALNAGANVQGSLIEITTGTVTWTGNTWNPTTTSLSGGTLDLNAVASATTFNLSGGTLGGSSTLTAGTFNWTAGTMTGSGTTTVNTSLVLNSGSTMFIGGGRVINSNASANWQAGNIQINSGGATINNNAPATFTINSDADFVGNGGAITFNNASSATLQKSSGAATTDIGAGASLLNNNGTLTVNSGTLLIGNGTSGGGFGTSGGGIVEFGPTTTHALTGTSTAGGNFKVSAGTVNVAGSFSVNATDITGGTLNINAAGTTGGGTLSGSGTLGGTAQLLNNGIFNWTGGTMTGSGTFANGGGGILNLTTGTHLIGGGRQIDNGGTMNWSAGNIQHDSGGATITNQSLKTLNISGDVSTVPNGGALTFTNNGTIDRNTATGIADIQSASITNAGTVVVNSGTLRLGNGSGSGSYTSVSGGVEFWPPSSHTITGTVTGGFVRIAGSGTTTFNGTTFNVLTMNVDSPGTINFDQTATITNGGVLNFGGTIGGSGAITLTTGGTFQWNGGTINGSGTLTAGANTILDIGGAGFTHILAGTRTLRTSGNGVIKWSNGDVQIDPTNPVIQIQTGGLFWIASDRSLIGNSGALSFNVSSGGTVQKTNGSGLTDMSASTNFNNGGSVDVQAGQLRIGPGISTGSFNTSATAALEFATNPGTQQLLGSSSFNGSGLAKFLSGTTTVAGTFNNNININGGRLDLNSNATIKGTLNSGSLGGAGGTTTVSGGTFTWNGGTIDGTATLNIAAGSDMDIASAATHILGGGRPITVDSQLTWTGAGNIQMNSGGASVQVNNLANFTISSDGDVINNSGVLSITNQLGGLLRKQTATGLSNWDVTSITNNGLFEIANGIITISGAYTQNAGADFTSHISGITAGSNYGQLNSATAATISGDLSAVLGAYVPNNNDTFDVVTYPSRLGDFTFTGATYTGGSLSYTPTATQSRLTAVTATTVDLSLTASATPTPPATSTPGGNIDYAFTISNAGPAAATGVTLSVTLPSGVTYGSVTGATSCAGSPVLVCTGIAGIAASGSATVTVHTTANATYGGARTVSATVSSTETDTNGTNNGPATATANVASAQLHVTTNSDSGDGSLRKAINDANDATICPSGCTISFAISSGPQTIAVLAPLPMVTRPNVMIDGTTQPGYAGTPLILIDGTSANPGSIGLHINATGFVVRDLSVRNFTGPGASGIGVSGVSGVQLLGNVTSNNTLGIDLDIDGPTPNDPSDSDTGANDLQNFPVISSAVFNAGTLNVTLSVDSPSTGSMRIDVFQASGSGEGQTYLGSDCRSTPLSNDNLTFSTTAISAGATIVTTATSYTGGGCTTVAAGTSEYSAVFTTTGCTATAVPITATGSTCPSVAGLTASITAVPGASYAWGITNGTITSSTTGTSITYTGGASGSTILNVTVTDGAGCVNTGTHTVTITSNPTATITAPATICSLSAGNTASVPIQGGATYAWSITNGTITSATNTDNIVFTAGATGTTTLNVTVTASGCTSTGSHSATINPQPTATITAPPNVCALSTGNSASVNPTAGATYAWSITNGTITSPTNGTNITFNAGATGNVTLNVTVTAGGCSTPASQNVPITPIPSSAITTTTSTCPNTPGLSASVPVTAGATYAWTITNGTITSATNIDTITYTAGASGTTTLFVTVTASGCSSNNSQGVTITSNPVATITAPVTICSLSAGNTASVPIQGGATYVWSITNGTITSATNTDNIVFTAGATGTTTLSVTVTASGCTSNGSHNATINPQPTATITAPPNVCAFSTSNSASVNPTGGATYAWSITNGTITSPTNGTNITFDAGATGNVTLNVTVTAGGCSTPASQNVPITPAPAATITSVTATCPNTAGLVASVPVTGGATYSWSITNGSITSATNTDTITYTAGPSGTTTLSVTVTVSGCSSSDTHAVTINSNPVATITTPAAVCASSTGNNASVAVQAGAVYAWSITNGTITSATNGASIVFTAGPTGSVGLSVTVTQGSCTSNGSTTIPITAPLNVTITGPTQSCPNTSFTLNAGAGFASYFWSNGATGQSITVAQSASTVTYSVTVTNGGCSATDTHTVTLLSTASATITAPNSALPNENGLNASVPADAGATFSWAITNGTISGPANTESITFSVGASGTTSLTVSATKNGCTVVGSHTVTIGNPAVANLAVTKSAQSSVQAGGTLLYTIGVTNSGPDTATNVLITDSLPPGTSFASMDSGPWNCVNVGNQISCTGTAPAGNTSAILITVTAPNQGGTITNSVEISTTGADDPNPANNIASATTTVVATPSPCSTVPPSLLSPADGATITSPQTFSWTAVEGAVEYELWTITGAITTIAGGTSNTSLTLQLQSGPSSWFVIARLGGACDPLRSAQRSFTVADGSNCGSHSAPQVSSPVAGSSSDSPVTISWSPVPQAIGYRVWIEANGTTPQDIGTTNGAISLIAELPAGSIVVYVDALFSGCPSTRSASVTFTVNRPDPCATRSAPTPASPTNNSTVGSSALELQWSPAINADGYRVWFSQDGGTPAVLGTTTNETSLRATLSPGTIVWWLEGLYNGCASTESVRFVFTIPQAQQCSTAVPALVAPQNNSNHVNGDVTFSWTSIPGALNYELWLAASNGTPILLGSTAGTTFKHTLGPGEYEWFVRVTVDRCAARDSQKSHFTLQTPPNCVTRQRPEPVSPLDGSALSSPVTFSWNAPPAATSFDLFAIRNGVLQLLGSTTSSELGGVTLTTGDVRWFVRAHFNGCAPLDSEERLLEVILPVEACTPLTAPLINAPGQISSGVPFLIQWTPVAGATSYQLELAGNANFAGGETIVTTATQHELVRTSTVYARVRAIDGNCRPIPGISAFGPTSAIFILPQQGNEGSAPLNGNTLTYKIPISPQFAGQTFTATVKESWMTVSPSSGVVGAGGTLLTVTADTVGLPLGTSLGAVTVTLTSPSSGNVQSHGTTVTIPTISVSLVTPVTSSPKSGPPPDALIIAAVAHADGINSRFQSDVRVSNTSPQLIKYQLTFTPSGGAGISSGKQTTFSIEPGRTVALDDILKSWFGTGSDSAVGTLEIRPLTQTTTSTSSAALSGLANLVTFAASRTFNLTSNGTFGQYIPAIPFANFVGRSLDLTKPTLLSLQQIAQSDRYRTNLGLVEGSGQPASLLVKVFGDAGQKLTEFPVNLAGGEHTQLNAFLTQRGISSLNDGRVEIQVLSPTGKVTAYASVLDNQTSDPLLVTPVTLTDAGATRWVLPGVADLNNGFANWQTDMRVFNAGSTPAEATFSFYPQGNGAVKMKSVTIPAGQVAQFDKTLSTLFGVTNDGGAVHISTATATRLIATARTYNQTTGGTYGQFISAVTPAEAAGLGSRPLQILQVEESNRFRSNIGLAEVTGNPVKLEIAVIPPDAKITTFTEVTLQPNEFRQIGSLLKSVGLEGTFNARVTVRVIQGSGRITAYASVIDAQTNDPTYVPAQ